ncbi:MAG: HAMP domain-containing sensor histidine kinase [Saprospiraceae bacterium]|nr:HAMP domain-containing sensor histidine kinase [Saprospiraceae bacterium]
MIIAFGIGYCTYQNNQNLNVSTELERYLETEFTKVKSLIATSHPSELDFTKLDPSIYDVLIQKEDSSIYWNNYLTSLENIFISTHDYILKYKDKKGAYTKMIGLDLSPYGKATELLKNRFQLSLIQESNTSHNFAINDYKNQPFNFKIENLNQFSIPLGISFYFYLLGIAFLLVALFQLTFIAKKLRPLLFLGIALALWFIQNYFFLPFYQNTYLGRFENMYSNINPSLTYLLANLCFVTLFINAIKKTHFLSRINPWSSNILAPFIVTTSFIYTCFIAKGFLFSEPLHSFYGELVQYKLQGFIFILAFIYILALLFYFSVVIFNSVNKLDSQINKYFSWGLGLILTYPISIYFDIQIPLWTIYTFIISYLLILELYLENEGRQITYAFWWIIILSGFLASITFFYRLHDGITAQTENINKLYSKPIKLHSKVVANIDSILQTSDVFEQLSALSFPSRLDKNDFEDYISKKIYPRKQNGPNFRISIEATDNQGGTLFNNHFSTSYSYSQAIATANRITEYIYYNPFDNAYFLDYFIENKSYNASPLKLNVKIDFNRNGDFEILERLNYLIFKNDKVIKNHLNFNTDISINTLRDINESNIDGDISYAVYKPDDEVKIVAYSEIGGLIKPISLFSFIVGLSGILLFLVSLFNTRLKFLPSELDLKFYDTSSLRTRIQLTIIMLIVFSFFIIGIVTAFYFKNVLENNNLNTQRDEVSKILNDIQTNNDGVENNYLAASTLQSRVNEMAHIHDKNLVFFDHTGQMQKASFIVPKINRVPFEILRSFANPGGKKNTRASLNDNKYTIDFIPVYYIGNNPYGYLGISYKPINNSNRSIRDFLNTILNVYIFLFLIAGALAIAIGNSITKPLSILSNKLKDFKLGKSNQALKWNTKDEIGKLINEYNLLTKKLDESVNMLAKTERDGAWREMAKQVAHEIKNPLTPMKLSIQYLDKAIQANPDNAQDLIKRVSSTLIEQINNLNQIANEFSNFAKMPKASNEKIIINEIVEAIHDLFRKREDMDIQMSEPIDDLYVFADRNHLVRILNNIVKNAIQAIPTDKKGVIKMSLTKREDIVIISVKDNGTGIPDDMKEKVFTPNFTTKSSGTGLGLAISANMIESFNGRIYFETEVGIGTEFFIEIPLMRLQDNFPGQNRVMLD